VEEIIRIFVMLIALLLGGNEVVEPVEYPSIQLGPPPSGETVDVAPEGAMSAMDSPLPNPTNTPPPPPTAMFSPLPPCEPPPDGWGD